MGTFCVEVQLLDPQSVGQKWGEILHGSVWKTLNEENNLNG